MSFGNFNGASLNQKLPKTLHDEPVTCFWQLVYIYIFFFVYNIIHVITLYTRIFIYIYTHKYMVTPPPPRSTYLIFHGIYNSKNNWFKPINQKFKKTYGLTVSSHPPCVTEEPNPNFVHHTKPCCPVGSLVVHPNDLKSTKHNSRTMWSTIVVCLFFRAQHKCKYVYLHIHTFKSVKS